ncbi:hypothetical protein SAMN04489752_2705 [Brevibacterium siliguriense]|uniref:Uncharacterized protein n=2 Tax=Brevibacterium siliguriense TaxID=1136497 RepID=A0A1H1VPX6_9MICO|nr:hypothetical protein SAMN04489752_2705 [Brevibacterium siliguriense]
MHVPIVTDLPEGIDTLGSWQHEGLPVQVHPGNLGWYQCFGSQALASALRVWAHDGYALTEAGWTPDELWTVLHRRLAGLVPSTSLRLEAVAEDDIADRISVEATAIPSSSLTIERWAATAAVAAYRAAGMSVLDEVTDFCRP